MLMWLLLLMNAFATQDREYGLGGTSTGRVTALTGEAETPFSALLNPALLPHGGRSQVCFNTSFVGQGYQIETDGVRVDSAEFRTQRGVDQYDRPAVSDVKQSLWAMGLSIPFKVWGNRPLGIGFVASGPYEKLRSFRAGSPYDFYSLKYGGADSQFKGTLALGGDIVRDHLSFGAGLSLFLTAAGAADATLTNENPTGRFALDVGLNTSWLTGLYGRWEEYRAGLVFRQKVNPSMEQSFQGKVPFGGTDALTQPMVLRSTMYYEPAALEGDIQRDFERLRVSIGAALLFWSDYKPSYLVLTTQNSDQKTLVTQTPPIAMRNTLNPRVSFQAPLYGENLSLAWGYQYRPSPVVDLSGNQNLLDANTHVLGTSLRWRFELGEPIMSSATLGVYGQYHWITTREVVKSDGKYIGGPGYRFSGNAYCYGVSLETAL